MNKASFSEDSMSIVVDDRFFQSESLGFPSQIDFNLHEPIEQREEIIQSTAPLASQFGGYSSKRIFPENTYLLNTATMQTEDKEQKKEASNQKREGKQKKELKEIRKNSSRRLISEKKKQNSKNYRQRKKQFIHQLQEENNFYKRKCIRLEQKLFQLESQIAQLRYDQDNHQKYGYEKEYYSDIALLKSLITNQTISNHELAKIAMKMREKYGPAGRDRKLILNYYMSEYINSTLADFQKYIFHSVLRKSGPFGQVRNALDEKVEELLSLTPDQKHFVKTSVLDQLYPVAISFSNCCQNIYKNYVQLLEQAKKFHDTMSVGLNYSVVPQLTRIVVWFAENKNMMEVRKLKEEWIRLFSGQYQHQIDQAG